MDQGEAPKPSPDQIDTKPKASEQGQTQEADQKADEHKTEDERAADAKTELEGKTELFKTAEEWLGEAKPGDPKFIVLGDISRHNEAAANLDLGIMTREQHRNLLDRIQQRDKAQEQYNASSPYEFPSYSSPYENNSNNRESSQDKLEQGIKGVEDRVSGVERTLIEQQAALMDQMALMNVAETIRRNQNEIPGYLEAYADFHNNGPMEASQKDAAEAIRVAQEHLGERDEEFTKTVEVQALGVGLGGVLQKRAQAILSEGESSVKPADESSTDQSSEDQKTPIEQQTQGIRSELDSLSSQGQETGAATPTPTE